VLSAGASLLVTVALLAVGCGGGGEPDQQSSDGEPPASEPTSGTLIELVVGGGEIEGGARRESVSLGENVTVRVSGDSTDRVHIHGYDQYIPLTDGEGEITFPALIPGVFEVELEGSGTLLIQLEVS
jgi:hypothetical protein